MFDAALKATAQALGIRIPDYRFHKHSGQAVVTVFGRDVYLGVTRRSTTRVGRASRRSSRR
jgi:hypothetical protein